MRRVYLPKVKLVFSVFFFIVVVVALVKTWTWSAKFVRDTGLLTPLKYHDGRMNVLLLGIGGGTHTGADLTDTMMVLSVKSSSLSLLSLPRDIWSDTLKDKINSAYHYGEEKKKGGGLTLAKAIVEDVVGISIHYSLVIDFSGFTKVIDLVGGVTLTVPHAFTDSQFPIEGKEDDVCNGDPTLACRYEVVRFESGTQTMDGKRALTYVRSRQAEGEEGSDFARSRRQQEVFVALKEKLMKPAVWVSSTRTRMLLRALEEATDTDMNIGEFFTVGKAIAIIDQQEIRRISLDDLLYAPPSIWYGRYVLIPKESFEAIHEFVENQLQ